MLIVWTYFVRKVDGSYSKMLIHFHKVQLNVSEFQMYSKPPKGLIEKKSLQLEDAEVLWHLLNTQPNLELPDRSKWLTFAFGLLGGLDFGQQSNLLRDRPVRVQVYTHRTSLAYFCETLQLGFEEHSLSNQWTPDDVRDFVDMAEFVFLVNRQGVWRIQSSVQEDPRPHSRQKLNERRRKQDVGPESTELAGWWARNQVGKVWYETAFSPKRSDRLLIIEGLQEKSIQEILQLILAEQCAHFINSTGVEAQTILWQHHIRRPSLRKSWQNILMDSEQYYWASLQLYHEIRSDGDVAFREKYIQFLLMCAEYLECLDLKSLAIEFRTSQRYWQSLSTLLLDQSSKMLANVPNEDWMDLKQMSENAARFSAEEFEANEGMRLQLMDDYVAKIAHAETRFFLTLSEILSGLAIGTALMRERLTVD